MKRFYTLLLRWPLRATATALLLTMQQLQLSAQTPTSISNCILWLDASDVNNTGINPANNSTITSWKDRSGNNNHATILSGKNGGTLSNNQINGLPVVHFTRVSDMVGSVYETSTIDIRAGTLPAITIFTVYKQGAQTTPASDQAIWGCDNGGWDRFFFSSFPGYPTNANNGGVSQGTYANLINNSGLQGVTQLLTAVYDHNTSSGGSAVYFNGAIVTPFTDATTLTAAQTTLRIGWDGDNNCYNGDIAEMILYSRKLTDCEIQQVNHYLAAKYGATFSSVTIDTSGVTTFNNGQSVTLTSHTTGTAYQWLKNGVPIGSATSRNYTVTSSGNYRVITTNTCPDTSIVQAVTVIPTPIVITGSTTAVTATSANLGGNVTDSGSTTVADRGIVYATTLNPTVLNNKVQIGTGAGVFSQVVSGLTASTLYHVRAYATNSAGTRYGADSTFTTSSLTLAVVTTASPSLIGTGGATLGGTVGYNGGAPVTERGVVYAQTANPTTANTKMVAGSGGGSFNAAVSGLTAATTYHVRAYAINSVGTSYGGDSVFTTLTPLSAPVVTTSAAAAVTTTTATLGGNVVSNGNAAVTERGVVYATSVNPRYTNNKVTIGSGNGVFTQNVAGLTPATTYHVRAYAINSVDTSYGGDSVFTTLTPQVAPVVVTLAATAITNTAATLGGNVVSNGNATVTERGVVYATTLNPRYTNNRVVMGNGNGIFSQVVNSLAAGTTYHVRAYAINSVDTSYGGDSVFSTPVPLSAPVVLTGSASLVTTTSATLSGNVISDGNATVTQRGVVYNTTLNPTLTSSKVAIGSGMGVFSQNVTGLTPATSYHVRAYAINAVDTTYGGDSVFVTLTPPVAPTVGTAAPAFVDSVSARLGGTVSNSGGAAVTEYGVVYAVTANPTTANSKMAMGAGTGTFSATVTGLSYKTTYHVRAYAINSAGTSYGSDSMFTTLAGPAAPATDKPAGMISPNNDGHNDTWYAGDPAKLKGHDVVVYTIFGQEVFHSVGYDTPFDGTKDGTALPPGEYYYLIKGPDINRQGALVLVISK